MWSRMSVSLEIPRADLVKGAAVRGRGEKGKEEEGEGGGE